MSTDQPDEQGPLVWGPPAESTDPGDPVQPVGPVAAGPDPTLAVTQQRILGVVGAVLTGGASRRMGTDKALLQLDGVPLGRLVVEGLQSGGAERVVLVGDNRSVVDALWLDGLPDRWPGFGPLGGIATAVLDARPLPLLTGAISPKPLADDQVVIVVAACDQPDLGAQLIGSLIDALRTAPLETLVAIPQTPDGRRHPLPTAWRASAGPVLRNLIESGARRADAAFDVVKTVLVPASAADLRDIDSAIDLETRRNRGAIPPPLTGLAPGEPSTDP